MGENGEDIISSLPDAILLNILYYAGTKHAVQTSILSKRWRDLWTSLQRLSFNSSQFYSPKTKRYDGFLNFVDQLLFLRDNSDIDTFDLTSTSPHCEIKSRLNAWIVHVIRRHVIHIVINVWSDGIQLPKCLFTCNSLTRLELFMGGKDLWPMALPYSVCLPNLVCLHLHSISFDDEYLTNKFFSSCPNLEELSLIDVEFLYTNVNISALKLKDFRVGDHFTDYYFCGCLCTKFKFFIDRIFTCKFKLYAPNLTSLSCKDFMSKAYTWSNFTSLLKADIDMKVEENTNPGIYLQLPAKKKQMYAQRMMELLRVLYNVEVLKLSPWVLEVVSGDPNLLGSLTTQFCNLRCLRLKIWLSEDNIHAVTHLLNISPMVESLFLEINKINNSSEIVKDNWEEGFHLLFHLKSVEIRGVVGCANELKFLEMLLKNGMIMEKLVVFTCKEDSTTPGREKQLIKFCEKLLTFPRASSNITICFF